MIAIALGQCDESGAVKIDAVIVNEVRVLPGVLSPARNQTCRLSSSIRSMPRTTKAPLGDRVLDFAFLRVDQEELSPAVALRRIDDLVGLVEVCDGSEVNILGVRSPDERRGLLVDQVAPWPVCASTSTTRNR